MISPRLKRLFDDYQSYHRTRGNQVSHYFGISLIVLGLLGLLSHWELGVGLDETPFRLDGGVLLWGFGLAVYLWLDWRLGVPFGMVLAGVYFLGRVFPTPWLWGFFVLGWILQGIGHYHFEKKSPAFFKNFLHLLIGPLWIFAKLIGLDRE